MGLSGLHHTTKNKCKMKSLNLTSLQGSKVWWECPEWGAAQGSWEEI